MQESCSLIEAQLDAIISPAHHYGGLAAGNMASQQYGGHVSHPRAAALQGLEKMAKVAATGAVQLIAPPPMRPHHAWLQQMGINDTNSITSLAQSDPRLLSAACSAAAMWTANMATITPACDTSDATTHITPANLSANMHRSHEAEHSMRVLAQLCGNMPDITLHPPLPAILGDEGAANHMRLHTRTESLHLFIYGRDDSTASNIIARQHKRASEAIIRTHHIQQALLLQQSASALQAGVFHHDVIGMHAGQWCVLHEQAFAGGMQDYATLQQHAPWLDLHIIPADMLSLEEAVRSYLFNSQLILNDSGIIMLAALECQHNTQAQAVIQHLQTTPNSPLHTVHYVDLTQSMRNGGGAACLRLRLPFTPEQLANVPAHMCYSPALHATLAEIITAYYPEQLTLPMLADAQILAQLEQATSLIWEVLHYTP